MNTPLLGHNIGYDYVNVEGKAGQKLFKSSITRADYQYVLKGALSYRHVKALIINEAQHMCRVVSKDKTNRSLDVIKSLVNESEAATVNKSATTIVLVGTYDLLNILKASAEFSDQIHERVHIIDFVRYHEDNKEDMQCFGKAAKGLLYHMPFELIDEKLVEKNREFLYMYSLGCIGSLKRWFMRAYSIAIEQRAEFLTIKHLEKAKKSGASN